jgi:hypothetical protein
MALVLAGQSTAAEDLSRKNYDHMVVDVSTGTDTSETAREKIESEIDKHDAFSRWRLIAVVQGTTAGGASNGDWRLFFEREKR